MGSVFKKENVSDDVLRQLILKPKESFSSNRYNKIPHWKKVAVKEEEEENKKDLLFFIRNNDEIILPFFFASQMTQKRSNFHLQHPNITFTFTENLYEIQDDIAKQALSELSNKGTTILNLYTGSGKTVVGIYLAAKLQKLTLILVASLILIPQWKTTLKDFSDATFWVVGEEPPPVAHVIICMYTQFSKLPSEYVKNIGTVIIDEAHEFCTEKRINCLLGTTPQYVIAMTATLERPDGMHSMIHLICGTEAIKKISKKPFNVFKYNTGISVIFKNNKMGEPDWNDIKRKLTDDQIRNKQIIKIVTSNPSFKILILTWLVDHVTYLTQELIKVGENIDYMAGNKKSYSDSRILIGTIDKIGTGFDEKTACANFNGFRINMLLLVGSIKSLGLLEQVAGRVFRSEFPQIIHFVDDMKIIENHWKQDQKWYKSRNGNIIEFNSEYYLEKQKEMMNKPTSPINAQLAFIQNQQKS